MGFSLDFDVGQNFVPDVAGCGGSCQGDGGAGGCLLEGFFDEVWSDKVVRRGRVEERSDFFVLDAYGDSRKRFKMLVGGRKIVGGSRRGRPCRVEAVPYTPLRFPWLRAILSFKTGQSL